MTDEQITRCAIESALNSAYWKGVADCCSKEHSVKSAMAYTEELADMLAPCYTAEREALK